MNANDEFSFELIEIWRRLHKKPKVIVFDLDYTLWPYYVDFHVTGPINKITKGDSNVILDARDFEIRGFDDVAKILKTLKYYCLDDDQHLAIASRTPSQQLALDSLHLLDWHCMFSSFQIYPLLKEVHMSNIKEELQLERFQDILFFDDEQRNLDNTARLGVVGYKLEKQTGLSLHAVKSALLAFDSSDSKNML